MFEPPGMIPGRLFAGRGLDGTGGRGTLTIRAAAYHGKPFAGLRNALTGLVKRLRLISPGHLHGHVTLLTGLIKRLLLTSPRSRFPPA